MDKINSIRRKLTHLQDTVDFNKNLAVFNDANGNADLFDVVTHRYQLGPQLTESELTEFEQRYAISLPHEYRAFLLAIGNGGAGPYHGLYTLAKGLTWAERHEKLADETMPTAHPLARPFPFTAPFIRPDYAGNAAVDLFLNDIHQAKHVQGTLAVANFGCGIDALLVITGQARGSLWLDDRHSDNGVWTLCLVDGKVDIYKGFDLGIQGNRQPWQGCDFLLWYEDWLDERIDIHDRYQRGEWHAPWTEARRDPTQTVLEF